ncbi:hypothetical protein BSKO_01197 [Bryopsis sp. KO-2023]|nr:hypothetical protein BSKO_01197 [Bryopsis sp. KO-2023]
MASQLPSGFVENPSVGPPLRPKPRKRQAEHLLQDCKRLCSVDIESPFTDLHDTIHRLLPFHLFHSEEGGEADLEETPDGQGKDLLWSRHEAWEDMCLQKAGDFAIRSQAIHGRLQMLDKLMGNIKRARPEEELMLERLASQDVHDRYVAQKAKSAHAFQIMAQMTNTPGSSSKQHACGTGDAGLHGFPTRQAAPIHIHNEGNPRFSGIGGQSGSSPSFSGAGTSSVSGRMLVPVQSGMDHGFQSSMVMKGLIPPQKMSARPALAPSGAVPRTSAPLPPLSDIGLHSAISRAVIPAQSSDIDARLPGASNPGGPNHGISGGMVHGVLPRTMVPSIPGEIRSMPRGYEAHSVDQSLLPGRALVGNDAERLHRKDEGMSQGYGVPSEVGNSLVPSVDSSVLQKQSVVDKGQVVNTSVMGSVPQWKTWHTMGSQDGLR